MTTIQHDVASSERIRSALSHLNYSDRNTWVRAAMCIKHELGEEGFEIWDEWGAQHHGYNAKDARTVWKSIKDAGSCGTKTIASLFYDAKQAGWKDGSTHKKPNHAEIDEHRAAAAARAEQAAVEGAQRHAAAAARAQELWDAAEPLEGDGHPYLQRKGVLSHGLRVGRWERIDPDTGEVVVVTTKGLLIPIRDRQCTIWGLQCIQPDPDRKKLYLKDCAKSGNFYVIGAKPRQHDGKPVFCLAEGYATGASVHEATGHMVLVCFDVSNLLPVARQLRARMPEASILFLADNDTQTDGNPGVTAARKAAAEVAGLVAVPPPGDFNDLQQAEGYEAVSAVIQELLCAALLSREEPKKEPAVEPTQNLPQKPEQEPRGADGGLWPTRTPHDEVRRSQQQEENQRIQEEQRPGAMIPSKLSTEEMVEHCVWIASGSQVAYTTDDRSLFLKFNEFCALTATSFTYVASEGASTKKRMLNAVQWKVDERRKEVMTVTFYPGRPKITTNLEGVRCVNTWRPIKRWPSNADIGPFLDQVEYLIPDRSEREVFLDWLAHIEQKPGELPHYGWLHIAEKTGTGRNWLASVLARVFKGYVAPNVDLPGLLDSAYNGELSARVLAIVDEVQEGGSEGNYRHAERLKSMINAETLTVNHKYGLKYTEVNACRWLVFSNHQNALPLKDTDRRFRVLMHSAEPRPASVYAHLYAQLQDLEFINAVGMFLRQRDIKNFKPGERPPMSEAKLKAIAASKPLSTQYAQDIVKYWPADVICYSHAAALLADDAEKRVITPSMRRALEEAGAITWSYEGVARIKINGAPHRIWILRNHAKWLAQRTDAVRAEVRRAKVEDDRHVSQILADAIEREAGSQVPPI
ncbi:MAG: PriCT-2 domain-containing protein [Burkholderiales bacterium]|nr:PriCT-2 domain-containing protein [Burkholderiales bacterium]